MESLLEFCSLPSNGSEWAKHITILIVNILLFLFAGPITKLLDPIKTNNNKKTMFRSLNVIFMVLHILDIFLGKANPVFENVFIKVAWSMVTLYFSFFLFGLLSYFSRQKFGSIKKLDGKDTRVESYNSRLVGLFLIIFTIFFDFYIFFCWFICIKCLKYFFS